MELITYNLSAIATSRLPVLNSTDCYWDLATKEYADDPCCNVS